MSQPRAGAAGTAAILLAVLALAGCGRQEGGGGEAQPPPEGPPAEVELAVDLYFPGPGGRLYSERREVATWERPEDQAVAILEALLAGPREQGLEAPFAEGVELGGLYLNGGGIVYVDLRAPGGEERPAMGSTEERQIVFSLVNSLSLNLSGIEGVVLLWNGAQPASFGGHLDTRHPLAPDPTLVARR